MPARIKLLVALHLILGAAPIAMYQGQGSLWLPMMWILSSIPPTQIMLVSLWAAMSSGRAAWRLLLAVATFGYAACWPFVGLLLEPNRIEGDFVPGAGYYLELFANYGVLFVLGVGVFWVVRRWFARVRHVPDAVARAHVPMRFSILHAMGMTSLVAVMLGLARAQWTLALLLMALVVTSIVALWAVLDRGMARWRILLTALAAFLLSIALSWMMMHELPFPYFEWSLVVGRALALAVPTMIVIPSLLVVRSCGYRLAPNAASAKGV